MNLPEIRDFKVEKNQTFTEGIFGLSLCPADARPIFSFLSGQWVMLHLLNEDGSVWGKAPFSIASAPHEFNDRIDLVIKVRGDFTKRAQSLILQENVKIQGPYGKFQVPSGSRDLIFIAGGIGIVPFRSMILDLCHVKDDRRIFLFYSTRTIAEMIFLNELRELSVNNSNFIPVFILTQENDPTWNGEKGRLNKQLFEKMELNLGSSEFLICGSKDMMEGIKQLLQECGVDLKKQLRQEIF